MGGGRVCEVAGRNESARIKESWLGKIPMANRSNLSDSNTNVTRFSIYILYLVHVC
jgi:hypothetical protein